MGCCNSTHPDPETLLSQKIDRDALKERKEEKKKTRVKLLLLGTGDSGKSTFLKQLRIIYGVGPTLQEKTTQIPVVYYNIINSMKILVEHAVIFGYERDIEAKEEFKIVSLLDDYASLGVDLGRAIKKLWGDPAIVKTWNRRSEFQIQECTSYFLAKIDGISNPNYVPSQEDILHARVRTNGVVKEYLKIDNAAFELYDVGGQRNERKKWIHCFDDVTAVIFIAALNEFDQVLFEDPEVNRMIEAIELFTEICNMRYFEKSSMILFLNKKDLFEQKILTTSISSVSFFSDYEGPSHDYSQSVEYFLHKFLKANRNSNRAIYHHITCATDTKNVELVFDACRDIILRKNLEDSGIPS